MRRNDVGAADNWLSTVAMINVAFNMGRRRPHAKRWPRMLGDELCHIGGCRFCAVVCGALVSVYERANDFESIVIGCLSHHVDSEWLSQLVELPRRSCSLS